VVIERHPVRSAWFSLSLAAAAAAAIPVAAVALAIIHARHGFTVAPLDDALASGDQLVQHVSATAQGVLLLFGADFLGLHMGFTAAGAMLHLVGVALAGWASWLGIRLYLRGYGSYDLIVAVLAAATVINLASYTLSAFDVDATSSREIAAVLPFAAVLAGRLLAARLISVRLWPALAAVLVGYLLTLASGTAQPALPTENQQVADWLVAHHLKYGVGGYWQAASVTLGSDARAQVRQIAQVRQVRSGERTLVPDPRESQLSWYDPRRHDATFIVLGPEQPPVTTFIGTVHRMRAIFGPPAHIYHVGHVTVLTYDKNLLASLGAEPGL
jgi:hypothetical protein